MTSLDVPYNVLKEIQAIIDAPPTTGSPPPFYSLMQLDKAIKYIRVAVGSFDLEWIIDAKLCHRDGIVQGGIVGVVADVAQACAFWSTSIAPETYSTSDFHTRFLRPMMAGTVILVESVVLNRSKRTGLIETRFTDKSSGKLHAIVAGGWAVVNRDLG